jgi:multidrug efflux pump subunit AcrA (membrane-fusion protein)
VIDAEARVRSDEARLAAARGTVKLLEDAVAGRDAVRPAPLAVELSGEVVECSARPGETVDAGQTIIKVARWDRLIARVDVPTGAEARADLRGARIEVVGREGRWLAGERVALGPVETRTGGSSWLFRVAEDGFPLRPGLPVVGRLAAPGERVEGVVIPRAAVVRAAGRAWAYVKDGEKHVRREVPLDHPTSDGWLAPSGFAAGEAIVTTGAQALLSEELKASIQLGD